jgi:site-specific DNA-methyltransferase (adenine-specific)
LIRQVIDPPGLVHGDALAHYACWPTPTVIVSDGAYGVGGFSGDPQGVSELVAWYEPHVAAWSRHAAPSTTLWYWGTEVGWATVHPLLGRHDWEYRALHVWDKGVAHIAGNANSKTLRRFPVVTEVCVQYVRLVQLPTATGPLSLKAWLRREWKRSGLPFRLANEACGVKDAATRKYLTSCHLWYCPPPDAFKRLVDFVNQRGDPARRPYFSVDGRRSLTAEEWATFRAKFHCEVGVTNVWHEPAVRGGERVKDQQGRALHGNQKPLKLMELILRASSDPGDVVWEPFGGLCSAAVAAKRLGRSCYAAEIDPVCFAAAERRLTDEERDHDRDC